MQSPTHGHQPQVPAPGFERSQRSLLSAGVCGDTAEGSQYTDDLMEAHIKLFAHLVTVLPLDVPQQLAETLTRLCRQVPLPKPYFFGDEDPPTIPWDLENISSVTHQVIRPTAWWFHWQRAAERESGRVSKGLPHLHGVILIRAQASLSEVESYVNFTKAESIALNADLAFIHVAYEDRPLRQDEPDYALRHVQSTVQLRRGLPDLPWATVFGRPYVEMFGREKLLHTPGVEASEITGGSIYLQLSELPRMEARGDFERAREAAKVHLGMDAFSESGNARVPAFSLQPPASPQILGWIKGHPVTGMIAGKAIVQTDEGWKVIDMPFHPNDSAS